MLSQMKPAAAALLLLLLLDNIHLSSALRDFIRKSDLPNVIPQSRENNWISLDPDTQFLPADQSGAAFSSEVARRLASSSSSYNPYASQPFADGAYEYNAYQQAWRYLGFMIDCDSNVSDQDDHDSGDSTGEGCSRYVLWAAYVDLEYEGGGIGEYQYWDRWTNSWDTTSCSYAKQQSGDKGGNNNDDSNGGSRCAKMDCHLEDTHFTPLGFFKHKDYDEWMGQLFKHEGMCIWTSDEYSFMKSARKAWPNGCMVSGSYYDDDKPIYYDLKPAYKGDITVGLYTDTRCTVEYVSQGQNDPITVENVVGNIILNGGSGKSRDNNGNNGDDATPSTLEEAQALWDSAFDIFKICQPCIAYDLTNVGKNTDDDYAKYYNYYYYYNNDDGGGDDFDCYDDAGYTNVNQVRHTKSCTWLTKSCSTAMSTVFHTALSLQTLSYSV